MGFLDAALSHREHPFAHGRRAALLGIVEAAPSAWRVAGGCNFRTSSGDGRIGRLDHRTQERALTGSLSGRAAGLWVLHPKLERGERTGSQSFATAKVDGLRTGIRSVFGGNAGKDNGVFAAGGHSADLLVEAGTHPVACGYCADLAVLCRGHRPLPGNGVAGEEPCRGERGRSGSFLFLSGV